MIKKWTEDLIRHFSQRLQIDGQWVYEKILNVTNHQGSVSKGSSGIPSRHYGKGER